MDRRNFLKSAALATVAGAVLGPRATLAQAQEGAKTGGQAAQALSSAGQGMKYKIFGKTGERVSSLGLGCMRLPLLPDAGGDLSKIDVPQATEMIRYAVDNGVNYIDTSYPYHGKGDSTQPGESEPVVGLALRDGYRAKVKLATKLPAWIVHTRADMDRFLDFQLDRLGTDHVDFYLVHTIQAPYWFRVKEAGLADFLDQCQKDGRVKHVGFSFHDTPALFQDVMNTYDWSFVQHVWNYLDLNFQAGNKGLDQAAARNMGIVAMEALLGGILVNKLPPEALEIFKNSGIDQPTVAWALRWVWNDPRISVLLSGMSNKDQVRQNINLAGQAGPNIMSPRELEAVTEVRNIIKAKNRIKCTECYRCSCPRGVDIGSNFTIYNYYHIFETPALCHNYWLMLGEEQRSSNCNGCGQCDGQCPEGIAISQEMKKVAEYFDKRGFSDPRSGD